MTHRPYPNADRALVQLNRHVHTVELPEWRVKMAADARRALAAGGEVMQPMVRAFRDVRLDVHPDLAVLARARHAA
ncbi:hypothetical protein GA0115253_107853 [Streptomyces sp. Termitarium-T10T-6]|nr:hypothetical protein [Streptomyces sp. Termitarium-T10T-6]SCE58514.1 hypothetical protein GA0115253_107853 [Streptomyces sp. Termitarium-T10T-6]